MMISKSVMSYGFRPSGYPLNLIQFHNLKLACQCCPKLVILKIDLFVSNVTKKVMGFNRYELHLFILLCVNEFILHRFRETNSNAGFGCE